MTSDQSAAISRPHARRFLVGVMGSGSEEYDHLAGPLGLWLASEGVDLLTGGGGGVMLAVCRAFRRFVGARGVTIGVLPAGPPRGYPNPEVEVVIQTHLPARGAAGAAFDSRNHINILSSDVIIALPGGAGTRTEVQLARHHHKPLLAWLGDGGGIEGIGPDELPRARSLEEVKAFVREYRRRIEDARCGGRKTLDKACGRSNIT